MLKYDNTVSSQVDGKPIYGAQVAVYTADTDTPSLATIFADEAGTTPLSQPILTDQLGYFAFYIGDGKYNIRVMTGAVEISRTNITMVDTLQLKQRALIVPVNEDGGTLPPADQRQGKLLGFDSGGNATMAVPNSFAGPTGPANSTYTTLAGLKAAAVSNASYIFAPPSGSDGGAATGTFLYQTAGAPYTADGVNVIKLDAVPLSTGALVRQTAAGVNFDGRNTDAKLRENVATTDARFAGGANAVGAADATAAFNAAKAASLAVSTPGQRFILNNLLLDRDYQRWELGGAVLAKAAAASVMSVSGRGNGFFGGYIDGGGTSEDNVVVTGQEAQFRLMTSRNTTGRPLLGIGANSTLVMGGVYKTDDLSDNGWDIEFRTGGTGALYNKVIGISTNQRFGGILLDGALTSMIVACQFGKLKTLNSGGAFVSSCRINGDVNILTPGSYFASTSFSHNITIGDGASANIGQIYFSSSTGVQSGYTFTLKSNVRESSFHFGQMISGGAIVNIDYDAWNNDIWLPERPMSIGIGAASGSPALGNSDVTCVMSSEGRRSFFHVDIVVGSTANFGSGNFFYFTMPFKAKRTSTSPVLMTQNGVGFFSGVGRVMAQSDQFIIFPTSGGNTATPNTASASYPFSISTGDRITFTINYERFF